MSKTNSLPCLFTFQEHDASKSSISDLHAVLGCTGVVVRTNYMQNIGTYISMPVMVYTMMRIMTIAVSNAHATYPNCRKLQQLLWRRYFAADLLQSAVVLLHTCRCRLDSPTLHEEMRSNKIINTYKQHYQYGYRTRSWPGRIQMLGRQGWRKRPELSFPRYTQLTTLPEL